MEQDIERIEKKVVSVRQLKRGPIRLCPHTGIRSVLQQHMHDVCTILRCARDERRPVWADLGIDVGASI